MVEVAALESRSGQLLYINGQIVTLMDPRSFEQFEVRSGCSSSRSWTGKGEMRLSVRGCLRLWEMFMFHVYACGGACVGWCARTCVCAREGGGGREGGDREGRGGGGTLQARVLHECVCLLTLLCPHPRVSNSRSHITVERLSCTFPVPCAYGDIL